MSDLTTAPSTEGPAEATYATLRLARRPSVPATASPGADLMAMLSLSRAGVLLLSTQDVVSSLDLADHVRWILDRIASHRGDVTELTEGGWWGDVFCFWVSRWGHGGPVIPADLLDRLGEMHLDLSLDIYGPFDREDDDVGQ